MTSEEEYSDHEVKRMVAVLQKEYTEILHKKRKRRLAGLSTSSSDYGLERSRSRSRLRQLSRSKTKSRLREALSERERDFSRSTETLRSSSPKIPSVDKSKKTSSSKKISMKTKGKSPSAKRSLVQKVQGPPTTKISSADSSETTLGSCRFKSSSLSLRRKPPVKLERSHSRVSTPMKRERIRSRSRTREVSPKREITSRSSARQTSPSGERSSRSSNRKISSERESKSRSRTKDTSTDSDRTPSRSLSSRPKKELSMKRERSRSWYRKPPPEKNWSRWNDQRSRSRSWSQRAPINNWQRRNLSRRKPRSRSRSVARRPVIRTFQEGDWECSCGQHNFARRLICFRCEAPCNRPVDNARGGMREIVRGRLSPNLARWKVQPNAPGDWKCVRCGVINFARRTRCFDCYVPRSSLRIRSRSRTIDNVSTSATPPPEALINYKKRMVTSLSRSLERTISRGRPVVTRRRKEWHGSQYHGGRDISVAHSKTRPWSSKKVVPRGGSPTRPGALERPTNFRDRVTRLARAVSEGSRLKKSTSTAGEESTNGFRKSTSSKFLR